MLLLVDAERRRPIFHPGAVNVKKVGGPLSRYTPAMARQKLAKTNAIRLPDRRRAPYAALAYDAAIHSAIEDA